MSRVCVCVLLAGLFALSGGLAGQNPKKDDPKAKKDDPPVKLKGFLPANFGKLGLSEDQKQQVYKIHNKYDTEIDKLEAKIVELKAEKAKEAKAVLTADQKKRLEDILLGKDK